MADDKLPDQPVHVQPSVINAVGAPTLIIDGCPNFGVYDGICSMTVGTAVRTAMTDESVRTDLVVIAHLRFGIQTAKVLKETLDKVILMASPPDGQTAH
jgi:hypothetical protein